VTGRGSIRPFFAALRHFEQTPLRLPKGRSGLLDSAALLFEMANLRSDLPWRRFHLKFGLAILLAPARQYIVYLGQGETQQLAFKNHLKVEPVAIIIPPDAALPSRAEQPPVLVEPKGPDRPETPALFRGLYNAIFSSLKSA
jgi:hypothetical protein